jgi:hypothetical protein
VVGAVPGRHEPASATAPLCEQILYNQTSHTAFERNVTKSKQLHLVMAILDQQSQLLEVDFLQGVGFGIPEIECTHCIIYSSNPRINAAHMVALFALP